MSNAFAAQCDGGPFALPPDQLPPGGSCASGRTSCGYDVDMWRLAASALGLQEGKDYVHVCMGNGNDAFQALLSDLMRLPGTGGICDVGVSSITAKVERAEKGIQFSRAIYRGSLAVMITAKIKRSGTWAFFDPLDWTVWLAMLLTAFLVPLIVLVLESIFTGRSSYRQHKGEHRLFFGLKEVVWHSMAHLLQVDSFRVHSLPSRIVVLGYAFMVTIVMATYTANLAAFLTIDRLDTSIHSADDLVGKAVATTSAYVDQLKNNYHISATAAYGLDYAAMGRDLMRGQIMAAIGDDTALATIVAQDSTCRLFLLPDHLSDYDISFSFAKDVPPEWVDLFNEQILILQESGQMAQLEESHLPKPNGCSSASETATPEQVTLASLGGLWFIIGGLIVAALVIAVLHYQYISRKAKSEAALRFALMRELMSLRRKEGNVPRNPKNKFKEAAELALATAPSKATNGRAVSPSAPLQRPLPSAPSPVPLKSGTGAAWQQSANAARQQSLQQQGSNGASGNTLDGDISRIWAEAQQALIVITDHVQDIHMQRARVLQAVESLAGLLESKTQKT